MLSELPLVNTHGKVTGNVPVLFDYTDPITKVTLTKKVASLFVSQDTLKCGNEVIVKFDTHKPAVEKINEFIGIQSLVKTCSDNAEDIKDRFLKINLTLKKINEVERLDIMKMDFMKLKDSFMAFIKTDIQFKTLPQYSSNQKMKPFRSDLNLFVLQRNIFTHGQILFLRPYFEFIIEYIDQSKKPAYAHLNKEYLKTYNDFYKEIIKLLGDFQKTRKIN